MRKKRTYDKSKDTVVVQTTIPRDAWILLKVLADKEDVKWRRFLRNRILGVYDDQNLTRPGGARSWS